MRPTICNINLLMTIGNLINTRTVPSRRQVRLMAHIQKIFHEWKTHIKVIICCNASHLLKTFMVEYVDALSLLIRKIFTFFFDHFNISTFWNILYVTLPVLPTPRSATFTTVDTTGKNLKTMRWKNNYMQWKVAFSPNIFLGSMPLPSK